MTLGHSLEQIAGMDYFHAVQVSWSQFHARMATSGLFLGMREEVRLLPYGNESLEDVVLEYRARHLNSTPPESVLIHDKAAQHPEWQAAAGTAVDATTALWAWVGLTFPTLAMA